MLTHTPSPTGVTASHTGKESVRQLAELYDGYTQRAFLAAVGGGFESTA